jgi:hypothetical protein
MKNVLSLASAVIAASALTASAQYYVNTFNNLNAALPGGDGFVPAPSATTTYSPVGSGVTYNIYSPDNASVYGVTDGSLDTYAFYSSADPFDRLGVQITSGTVLGIGGDFWLDPRSNPQGLLGISVGLSDASTVPFIPNGPNNGFWSPVGTTITGLWLSNLGQDPGAFPAMDNLWIAVPEPGAIITNIIVVIGALGGAWAYRRRKV